MMTDEAVSSASDDAAVVPRKTPPDAVATAKPMSPWMQSTTVALAEALFADEAPPPPARLAWLRDELSHFLQHAGTRARGVYGLCLFAIRWLAPLTVRRLAPLDALDLDTRTRALERFEQSPLALSLFGAKAMLCIVYYEHPEAAVMTGADGLCLVRKKAAS